MLSIFGSHVLGFEVDTYDFLMPDVYPHKVRSKCFNHRIHPMAYLTSTQNLIFFINNSPYYMVCFYNNCMLPTKFQLVHLGLYILIFAAIKTLYLYCHL